MSPEQPPSKDPLDETDKTQSCELGKRHVSLNQNHATTFSRSKPTSSQTPVLDSPTEKENQVLK